MKFTDYLLMNTLASVNDDGKSGDSAGQISTRRIVLSLIGLLVGIFFSFIITGIEKTTAKDSNPGTTSGMTTEQHAKSDAQSQISSEKTLQDTGQFKTKAEKSQTEPGALQIKPHLIFPGWKDLFPLIIISLVICGLSYQSLYANLKLYNNEPTFLVLFVAFQYGFFWEAVVKGVSVLV